MISFKDFQQIMLLEYLTPEQEAEYSKYKISKEAKDSTDHFFGKDSDVVRGVLDFSETHHPQKSEVHQKIEKHLNQEIPLENYTKGVTKDSYGREVKIGRLLKDEKLKNEFASDNTRAASKKTLNQYTTSTHRGTQVAGQTNSEHSWSSQSCKHIETGSNRKYLPKEISKGTVVHFVHDEKGKEIYRSTLQPYRNKEGDTLYHLDAEYGVKHPSFTKSSKETAEKLSSPLPKSIFGFKATEGVYNNSRQDLITHPKATPEHISKALEDRDWVVRWSAIRHPNATPENISKALEDKDSGVRRVAIRHPKATPENISKALEDRDSGVRRAAIEHPKATPEHISKALEDKHSDVRVAAIQHPNATPEHISKSLDNKDADIRKIAIQHPKATPEHISKALGDEDWTVRAAAIRHPKATPEHISKALEDRDWFVKAAAIRHPKATPEHISKALEDEDYGVRRSAIEHPNATPENISKALEDKDYGVREAAIRHPKATPEHISKALEDKDVREAAMLKLK